VLDEERTQPVRIPTGTVSRLQSGPSPVRPRLGDDDEVTAIIEKIPAADITDSRPSDET
jgi:hypothetical protein